MIKDLAVLLNYDEFTVRYGDKVIAKNTETPRRASVSIVTNFKELMTGVQGKRNAVEKWYHHNINNLEDLDV